MPSKILNFSKDRLITGINIIDGMLFFVDNETEPKKINIKKFRGDDTEGEFKDVPVDHSSGTTSIYNRPLEERDITVIKDHPQRSLSTNLISLVTSEDGTDSELGGGDIIDTGGGGTDVTIDLPDNLDDDYYTGDNDNLTTTSAIVKTNYPTGLDIQNFVMNGSVSHAKNIKSKGFYYTFDAAVGVSREAMLNSLNDKTFKKEVNSGSIAGYNPFIAFFSNNSSSQHYDADGFANQAAGDTVYYMAYAQEETEDFERYGSIISAVLKDANDDGSGTISGLTCVASYQTFGIVSSLGLTAEYDDDGGGTIQSQYFIVSKGYPNWNLPSTPPTAAEVKAQVDLRVYSENAGYLSTFPALIQPSGLNALGQMFGSTNPNGFTASVMPNLNDGFTYYAYAFMSTSSEPDGVFSNRVEWSTTVVMPPQVKHFAFPSADRITLKGEITSVGSPSEIDEKGFYFSKNLTQLEDLKNAFKDGVEADYTPTALGYTDTYKVSVNDELSPEYKGEFQLSTFAQMGALEPEEAIYYFAYAKNSLGATGYGSEMGYVSGGEIAVASTLPQEDLGDPIVTLTTMTSQLDSVEADIIKLNFEYNISYMPGNTAPASSGVTFTLPSGNEIQAHVKGFDTHAGVDGSKRRTDIPRNKFTFTSGGDSTFLGDYKTTSNYEWPMFTTADRDIFMKEMDIANPSMIIFQDPHGMALSAYAWVVHNNVTYKSEPIKIGTTIDYSNSFGSLSLDGCSTWNTGAATIQTQDNRGRNYTNLTKNSVTMEGRICNNGGTPGGSPINDIGFYWSKTDAPLIPDNAFDSAAKKAEIEKWIAKSTTYKKSVTKTSAMQAHQYQDDNKWFEFDAGLTSSDGVASGDNLHFLAFVKPRPQSNLGFGGSFAALTNGLNATKYGGIASLQFLPTHTAPQSGEEPIVSVTTATADAPGTSNYPVVFKGSAIEKASYYNITKKGFYYKPKSVIGLSATQAQIKTAMNSPISRTTLDTTSFPSSSAAYAMSANVLPDDYYVSAFCVVNTNGTETTYISPNSITLELPTINVVPEVTTPVVISKAPQNSFPATLQGEITQNRADITDRGFYVVGKSGVGFTKPTNGTALKALYDNPTTGVVTHKITGANSFNLFYKSFTAQKKGYMYYYVAYAKNIHDKEGLAQNVFSVYKEENVARTLEIEKTIVNFDHDGNPYLIEGKVNSGATALLRVKTEGGYDGNWRIANAVKFNGTNTWVYAYRQNNYGEWKLGFPKQNPNGYNPRRATLKIVHGSDPNIFAEVLLSQQGSPVEFDTPDDIFTDPTDPGNGMDFGPDISGPGLGPGNGDFQLLR